MRGAGESDTGEGGEGGEGGGGGGKGREDIGEEGILRGKGEI